MRRKKLLWIAPIGILAIAVFVFIGGESVRLLWNWLLPSLFGWREITFWQGLGILALSRILVGGIGGRGFRSSFRRRMEDRFGSMTPEERERFRQGLRNRCGFGPPAGESQAQ
jgi:hypothetical protein